MPDINEIAQHLAEIIGKQPADYIEAHLEESRTSHITYRGRELESIGKATAAGGNVRALVKGGWGVSRSRRDGTSMSAARRQAPALTHGLFAESHGGAGLTEPREVLYTGGRWTDTSLNPWPQPVRFPQ